MLEVPAWLDDGPEPSTITDGRFRPERLRTLRTRLSAAYKGIHALLMAEGAIDFRSGQPFGQTVFFDEYVDIHHIFPQDWCKKQKIEPKVFDTVINKTPLSYKTNRILGRVSPSRPTSVVSHRPVRILSVGIVRARDDSCNNACAGKARSRGTRCRDVIFETLFETLWVSNPIRPRSAASRNRVMRGPGVTQGAKRSQGARRPRD